MSNVNQWQFDELPNSKIIITEEVLNRLHVLIGRASWIASEHSATLFGQKIGEDNIWLIDDVNTNEDYVSRGQNSTSPLDYSISTGDKQSKEIVSKLESKPGTVVIDIHTHPSGLIDDYRFVSGGDLSTYIKYNDIVAKKGGTFFGGLIGVDRVNGNMSFSIIWYDKTNSKFYRIQNIYLRKSLENGDYRDFPFAKYGNTQLIMQTWGDQNAVMNEQNQEELRGFKHR